MSAAVLARLSDVSRLGLGVPLLVVALLVVFQLFITDANRARFKVASEAFGGIKDVKVLQRESAFVARFEGPAARALLRQQTDLLDLAQRLGNSNAGHFVMQEGRVAGVEERQHTDQLHIR